MRQRCTIERNQGGTDGHGAKTSANWQPHLTDVACCAYYMTGKLQQQPEQTEGIADLRLLLPVGTDIERTDRIGQIADRLGAVVHQGPLAIQGPIGRRADHLQLAIRQVR